MPNDVSLFMDYCKVIPPSSEQITSWNDNLTIRSQLSEGIRSARTMGLEVTLEATHSAFFNDNMRFYIPSRMEDGAKTFINGRKPAKLLKHHDAASDPVGIVIGAEYIHTIPDGLQTDRDVQILTDSSFSIKRQLAAARRLMKTGIPFSDSWRGLGYVQLKAVVFDDKTIGQISNELFDAVSTSFVSPGQIYCSICATNLAVDGFCEHEPGEQYEDGEDEDVTCALIPGMHRYKECSFVVFDADPLTAIEIGVRDSKDSKNKIYQIPLDYWKSNSLANDSKFAYEFKDFKEEIIMGNNQDVNLSDAQKEVFDFVEKLRPDMDKEIKLDFTQKIADLKDEEGNYPDQVEAELDLETYVLYAIENLETADQKINADEVYAEMEKDLQEDAKLSTEKRKNLGKSTFCGPDRSFPVPDCAHVTAAQRLIGRYKGPGNKSNILACIARKAKAFGCSDSEESPKQEDAKSKVKLELPSYEQLKTLSDAEAKEFFNLVETEVVSRQLKFSRPCGKCATVEDSLKTVQEELKQNKKTIKDNEDILKVLRAEMKFQMADYFSQIDHQLLLDTELNVVKQDKLALMLVLSGNFNTIEEANDSLKDVDLDKETIVINDNFKLDDILTKLNNGMSNQNPKGTIKDPTINNDKDNSQLPDKLEQPAMAAIRNIKDFAAAGSIQQAKSLYDRMVKRGYFSTKEVPFDSLSTDNSVE
jgi:hypothetical protein